MPAYLVENNADLDGAGLMGHFGPNTLPDSAVVIDWLDAYAEFSAALQITEFDVAAGWFPEEVEGAEPGVSESE